MPDEFTPAQKDAFKQIHHLMTEHFDAGVCICTASGDTDKEHDVSDVTWAGGYAHSLGALRLALLRLEGREVAREVARLLKEWQ